MNEHRELLNSDDLPRTGILKLKDVGLCRFALLPSPRLRGESD
jgi:hypothetical protein